MKYFFLGFGVAILSALVPELALAATAMDNETATTLNEELITVVTYTGAVLVFVGGWIVGSLT